MSDRSGSGTSHKEWWCLERHCGNALLILARSVGFMPPLQNHLIQEDTSMLLVGNLFPREVILLLRGMYKQEAGVSVLLE